MEVKFLTETARLPSRLHPDDAGLDLFSARPCIIEPWGRAVVTTGLAVKVPQGCYGRLAPRSGLAVHEGIDVGAGVIDAGYRGEIKVLLFNHSSGPVSLPLGTRVAQLIIQPIVSPTPVLVSDFSDVTDRGAAGFGSSGQ